jgi:hypothetical protein
LINERVPGEAAVTNNVVERFEDSVGQDIGALLGIAQVREPARWYGVEAEELGGFQASFARVVEDDRAVGTPLGPRQQFF